MGVAVLVELEFGNQLAPQVAARAFGKNRVFAVQFHAELEVAAGLAVLADTEVAGSHTLDGAVIVVKHFCSRKTGEYLNAGGFRLLGQPAHHIAKADDVVAIVVKTVRHKKCRSLGAAGFGKEQHFVSRHGLCQGCAQRLPVGDQLGQRTRVHHGAAQNMGAGL